MSRSRPWLRHAFVLAAVSFPLMAPAPAPASPTACAGAATVQATTGTLKRVRSAVVCLVNRERRARGLRAVRSAPELRRVARRHSADMVRRGYFSHVSPEGRNHVDRVRRTRYIARASRWQLAENLAWAPAGQASAAEIVQAWMASPAHRENILRGGMRQVGIGLALGTPFGGRGVTATQLFGRRG